MWRRLDAGNREDVEPRIRAFFETLSRLQGVANSRSGAHSLEDVGRTLLREGMQSLGALAGGVYLINDNGTHLELEASISYPADIVERYRLVPLSAQIPLTDAVKQLTPIVLATRREFEERYPAFTASAPDVALHGMACVPLEIEGRAIGALGLGFPLDRTFEDSDRGFLRALAVQCAHVLQRARTLETAAASRAIDDRAAARLAVLYAFADVLARALTREDVIPAIVDSGMAATSARSGGLWLLSEDGATVSLVRSAGPTGPQPAGFRSIPLAPAIRMPILDAIHRGTPVWLESCRQLEERYPEAFRQFSRGGESSLACIPLFAQGACIGGLALNYGHARRFLEDEREFFQLIAWHSAPALARSRLYAAEQAARLRAEAEQRRSAFLADAGMILGSSLDYASTLGAVARAAIPSVADWCIVQLEEDRVRGVPPVVAHVDPSKEAIVREASRRFRELDHDAGIEGVIRTCRSQLFARLTPTDPEGVAGSDPWLREAAREVACVSSMVVPIAARGRTIGAFVLASSNPSRLYGEADLAMAEELGRRAGIAVDNARLYRDAREADRLKDEFLAILSHELRNPLTPIITAVEMMHLRDSDAFARERGIIARNVHHVVRLVGDLLDVARITHGKITLQMARCDVARVIAKAQEMTAPLVAERRHRLSISVGEQPLSVIGDDARLAQSVANLMINAAKYTEPGGEIAVSAGIENESVVIRVRDTGAGIPVQLIGKIFDPFVQNERTLDRAQGGLGIGLTVVRSFVALHGGEVGVHSDGPGKGSEFTIRLPRAPAELAAPPALAAPVAANAERVRTSRLRVLVVDDNADVTEVMQDALGALDCVPEVAHDGASALAAAAAFQPDVAIVDIGMPGMDGYELARRLRALFAARAARIVALTGYGQEADRARAHEAGFDDHIVKPVLLTTLRELLQKCRVALSAAQD